VVFLSSASETDNERLVCDSIDVDRKIIMDSNLGYIK